MSLKDDLLREIENGRNGKSGVIPVCYDRVSEYIDIAKNTYYTVGGETGAAKSTIIQDMFIIRPIEWYLKNRTPDIKLSIIYFGMERKMFMYSARWMSRKIFEMEGIAISPKKILSKKKTDQMSDHEYKLVTHYTDLLDEWEKDDLLIAHEGSKNPSGMSMYLEAFARKHGTIVDKDKTDKSMENILETRRYTPNHPNHIVLVITDHIGILAPEKESAQTKTQIEKFSRTMREARDVYGFSPVIVQQLNRNMESVERKKFGELAPQLGDFADSGQTQKDSDVIMALFDPFRHVTGDLDGVKHNGYELKNLRDRKFKTYYRSLHILKNSFESAGMNFPMAVQPVYGILKTLPLPTEIKEDLYKRIKSGDFFLEDDDDEGKMPFSGFGDNKTHGR